MQVPAKHQLFKQLQAEILTLQGSKKAAGHHAISFGAIDAAFPQQAFPLSAVHELLSGTAEEGAATHGFLLGLLSRILKNDGICLWINNKKKLFPPALTIFGVNPERVIFVDMPRQKDALWVIEEALKCQALNAVVGEVKELSFNESRRLQLAVEQSGVTGFIHRLQPRAQNTVACVTRWKINPLPSAVNEGMPGLGFPRWQVQLLKVRNGKPGLWNIEWRNKTFRYITPPAYTLQPALTRKVV